LLPFFRGDRDNGIGFSPHDILKLTASAQRYGPHHVPSFTLKQLDTTKDDNAEYMPSVQQW